MSNSPGTDQDSPWKELLDREAPLAMGLLFPERVGELDWDGGYQNLDQELRALSLGGEQGKRIADCLIKTGSVSSDDPRYLHLEIQGERELGFPRRMYVYNYRAEDRFGQPVASFAVLVDDDPDWRPDCYESEVSGTKLSLQYSVAKILDWRGREEELRRHTNPMGLFVLAQLSSMETKKDNNRRADLKLELIRLLHRREMDTEDLNRWYRYLDWLLALPPEYDQKVWIRVRELTEDKAMPYVTAAERYGLEQGREQGLVHGIRESLSRMIAKRFPTEAAELISQANAITEPDWLNKLIDVGVSDSLEQFRQVLAEAASQSKKAEGREQRQEDNV